MPVEPSPDAPSRGDDEDAQDYDNFTHVEAIEEYYHGKRDQRSGKHGVKLKKSSGRRSGSLRKSGSTTSSLSAHSHPPRASKSSHSGKPKHFQNSTVDEMMEAHVEGESLVPPPRTRGSSRPSEVDQHKLEMEQIGQILDMFDIKGNFGARKEADAPVDGEPVTHRAQPIVNYSRRLSSSINSSAGAAHFTASSPLLPEATRISVPGFRSAHRLPSASDLEISNSPSHPSLPALVTPPPADTPRTALTETPSAAGTPAISTPGGTTLSPSASTFILAREGTGLQPEQSDSFMTAVSTPAESVGEALTRPPSSAAIRNVAAKSGRTAGQAGDISPRDIVGDGAAAKAAEAVVAQIPSAGERVTPVTANASEPTARHSNMFELLAGSAATDPAQINRRHGAAGSKAAQKRRKKSKSHTADGSAADGGAAGGGVAVVDAVGATVATIPDDGLQFVIADAAVVPPVSAIVPAAAVSVASTAQGDAGSGRLSTDTQPSAAETLEGVQEGAAEGWAPARSKRRPHRGVNSRPSSTEPRRRESSTGVGRQVRTERRPVTKPAREHGFHRSLTDTHRRRSHSHGSAAGPQSDSSGSIAVSPGVYAAGVAAATPHVLAHDYKPALKFPVAAAPPVQQPLLLPASAADGSGVAPQAAIAATDAAAAVQREDRRSTVWGGSRSGTSYSAAACGWGRSGTETPPPQPSSEAPSPAAVVTAVANSIAEAIAPVSPTQTSMPTAVAEPAEARDALHPDSSPTPPAAAAAPATDPAAKVVKPDAAVSPVMAVDVRPAENVSQPGHERRPPLSLAVPPQSSTNPDTPSSPATPHMGRLLAPPIPVMLAGHGATSDATNALAFPGAASFFAGTAPMTAPLAAPYGATLLGEPSAVFVAPPGFPGQLPFGATSHVGAASTTVLAPAAGQTPFGSPLVTAVALQSGMLPASPGAGGGDAASAGRLSAHSSMRPDGLIGEMSLDEADITMSSVAPSRQAVTDHVHGGVFPGAAYAADIVGASVVAHDSASDDGVNSVRSPAHAHLAPVEQEVLHAEAPVFIPATRTSAHEAAANLVPAAQSRDMRFAPPPEAPQLAGEAIAGDPATSTAAVAPAEAAAGAAQRAAPGAGAKPQGPPSSPGRCWADVAAQPSPPAPTATRLAGRTGRIGGGRAARQDFQGFQLAAPPHQQVFAAGSAAPSAAASTVTPGRSTRTSSTAASDVLPNVFGGTAMHSPRRHPGLVGVPQPPHAGASSSKGSVGATFFSGPYLHSAAAESSGVSVLGGSSAGVPSRASSSVGGAERSPMGQHGYGANPNPFQTMHFAPPQGFASPREVSGFSPFNTTPAPCTAPSTAADSMLGSSIDTMGGRSQNVPEPHERPIEAELNAVRTTMEAHRMQPFSRWTAEMPLKWHVLAIDVVLRVVEASMIAALNDSCAAASSDALGSWADRGSSCTRGLSWSAGGGSSSMDSRGVNGASASHGANVGAITPDVDDMYRGNETLAAFTLHHCMHVSLAGYARLNPFKHRSAQGPAVDCEDDRLPYPAGSGLASEEFHDKALPFIRMDVTSAAAVSTLSGFSQLEADTGEPVNDGPGDSRPGEEDNLFHRLKAVCTTVLHAQVQQEIGRDDPDAAIASFRHVLDRVERFIALDETQDPLSLHRLAGAGGDLNNIVLVFDTPDDQMRPPVVAYFVTWLLGRLLELTRDLACTAVDAFDKVTGPMSRRNGQNGSARSEALRDAWREAQITCLQAVLALWARLANMAASVCLQISRRLLRRERLERFGRRFRSDSIIWSTVLRSANIMFVMGWEGPGSQPLQRMGLLKHVPYALCDGARLATEGVPTAGSGSSKEYPHVHDIARTVAHDVNELIMGIISGQLNSMTCGLRVLKMALAKGNPEGQPSRFESTEAALKHTVEQWQSLRRDSQTRQLATFVKNLDSFFDIMINIVHMRENFEKKRILQDVEYIKSTSYINLKRDLADTFKWFLGFLLHTANLYLMYFEREWVFDRASQQYKERSPGGGYVAFRRGVTEATIRALLQQLNNACYIIRSLRDTEKRCVVTESNPRHGGGADDGHPTPPDGQGDATHIAARLPHILHLLDLRLKDILTRVPAQAPQANAPPEATSSAKSDRIQVALGLRHGGGRSGSGPVMPTLEELTHEIIEQRTLPADESYVAQARSTLGIICKHTVEPLIQDRPHKLPAPVAIKWINVHVDSRAHEAGRGGLSSAQRWALLSAEVSTMKRLRDSLQGPVPVRAGYPVAPPADGRLEEANVVIYLTVHASDLSMAAIRSLEDPEPTKLVQVTVNKRVGTVMEWLPNGSLNDLLGNITHEDMTLQAAVDATAWSRSRRASAPATPAHLAGLRVADVFTMPCCSNTLQELGGDAWMRAVIPPERSCKPLQRVNSDHPDVHKALDIFRSRFGVFHRQVPFPACKEPLEPGGKPPPAAGGQATAQNVRAAVPVLLLSFKWTLQLMLQAAKGVALCHRIGIAHRDLEPWNFMFDRFGRIKIIDFGDSLNQMRQISGSVGPLSHELYLAPEVRVWAHLADPRPAGSLQRPSGDAELLATDIWTLGVVFWQLLTLHQSKTLGMISVAGSGMERLRDELIHYEGCSDHNSEQRLARDKLGECGLTHGRTAELKRVPPLPFDPSLLRPAAFANTPTGRAEKATWLSMDESGGYRRLRRLVVSMLSVHHSTRPHALNVAHTLNTLLNDFREML